MSQKFQTDRRYVNIFFKMLFYTHALRCFDKPRRARNVIRSTCYRVCREQPSFVNLTTDDSHRALMGIIFGNNQLQRGHPLTVFLNDKGVLIGSNANSAKFADHQKALGELMSKGATVLICPIVHETVWRQGD